MRCFCLLLSAALALSSRTFSTLSDELLAEGLVTLSKGGVLSTTCIVSSSYGPARSQTCFIIEGFGPRSVGCFTIRNGTRVVQQGCYSNQEVAMRSQCKKRVCSGGRKHRGISFCCCYGHRCNAV